MFRSEYASHRMYWLTLALLAVGLVAWGAGSAVAGPVSNGPSIPRCVQDDYNDGSQDRCWSETVDGTVFVLNRDDELISTDFSEE